MSDKRNTSAPLFDPRTLPTSTESPTSRADSATPDSQATVVQTPSAESTGKRPAGCYAAPIGNHMICHRCGAAWPASKPAPCRPMTYTRMIVALIEQAERHEASGEAIMALMRDGLPGDPAPALSQAAALRAIARVIDLAQGDTEIKTRLAELGRGKR